MKPDQLSSRHNPILKEYRKLLINRSYRRKRGKIAVEGPNLIREALQAGLIPEVILITEEYGFGSESRWLDHLPQSTKLVLLSPALFKELAETATPQSVAAIFPFTFQLEKDQFESKAGLVIIADRLQDPGNMGTLIRTAAAAGVDLLICTEGCTDPFSPKVLRSTVGSIFRIGVREVSDKGQLLAQLKADNYLILAAAGSGGSPYWEVAYQKPLALIIGNEAGGVDAELLAKCDLVTTIPLQDSVESLNAAVAAGIILFEIRRQELAGKA